MVLLSSRAGVPVCKRPSWKPAARNEADRPIAGASSIRPAGKRFIPEMALVPKVHYRSKYAPMCISPDRNVPVQMTTCEHGITSPVSMVSPLVMRFHWCAGYSPSRTPVTVPQTERVALDEAIWWSKTRSDTLSARTSRLG
jgi:hypothetical protein